MNAETKNKQYNDNLLNEYINHSVIETLIKGFHTEYSPEVIKCINKLKKYASYTATERSESEQVNYLLKVLGIFEYEAINTGLPEIQALVLSHDLETEITRGIQFPVNTILRMFDSFQKECITDRSVRSSSKDIIYNVMQSIENNTHNRFSLEEISNIFGYHPSYISRQFKLKTGYTITEYNRKCRMNEASILLRKTNLSLSSISSLLCFSNQSHFQRVFKQYYGITPQQFRTKIDD
ncbi:MAG: helix-turn-helix transcriptional regulator [Erysipelotrichaceae bacterium]|nr:helix-turn-helix transcriptional regulator [Erysipelotrichaceae bacterium]